MVLNIKQFNVYQHGKIGMPEIENIKFPLYVNRCFQEEKKQA